MNLAGMLAAVLFVFSLLGAQTGKTPLSPAQRSIMQAQASIQKNPEWSPGYNDLALALVRRARETADRGLYIEAEQALQKSFRFAPDNFEGNKIRVMILLGRHEFSKAAELATSLNRQLPDDNQLCGLTADAQMALGNYSEAERSAQRMIDMRPASAPGLERGAALREILGDIDGARDWLTTSFRLTSDSDAEQRAWLLTRIARLDLLIGRLENADQRLREALTVFADYPYALDNLARVRLEQKRPIEAVELLRRRLQLSPDAGTLYALGKAWEQARRPDEAKAAYAEFEQKARALIDQPYNFNRELVFYYADSARKPAEAMRVARSQFSRYQDVHTLDALAWALYHSGEFAAAREQMQKALAVGIRDAQIFYHAGAIALKLNDRPAAARFFRQSLDLNPHSDVSEAAHRALDAEPGKTS